MDRSGRPLPAWRATETPYSASVGDPLPGAESLRIDRLATDRGSLTLRVSATRASARCPACDGPSSRVHGRYERAVRDLPWHGFAVTLRFFCDRRSCERAIFCERLPEVAAHARKTGRLEEGLLAIALGLGGEAGARLARELGLLVSPDTLLRRVRTAPLPDANGVRVLGVDDFAFKRGNAYGTILVDLERRRVVDLLPERSQEGLVAWLERHPGVEFAARDRSNIYREALTKGAPKTKQVADRWHLLHNLALTLEEFLLHKRPVLREAAMPGTEPEKGIDAFGSGPVMPNRPRRHERKLEKAARQRHERVVEQWRDIRRLYLAGADLRGICRRLGVSPRTVYRYKDLTEPPPRPAYRRRASVLDPYVPYLVRRWNEGCRNGKRLYREIREQGYASSEETCTHFVSQFRRAEANGRPTYSVPRARRGSVAGLSHLQERRSA